MYAPRAVLGLVKRGVSTPRAGQWPGEARGMHDPLPCPRYFTHYTARS